MKFKPFSPRQRAVLTWWCEGSPHRHRDAIICDGAVRSGKTLCLSLSFVLWALVCHRQGNFALCGKTVTSLRRNVVTPLCAALAQMGIPHRLYTSRNLLEVYNQSHTLRFYLFGGRDEGSAALIQGVTLSGVLLDEVVLMPRSFVEQALARCSVEGSKFFFCCNPEHPHHWFYTEWILRAKERNALYLRFTMEDNPSLSPAIKERYRRLYTGAFYQRFVLGQWVAAHGAVYPMFGKEHVVDRVPPCIRYAVSCDYGTLNPASFGLWGQGEDGVWYRLREYYHDARATGIQKTDEEYADDLEALVGDLQPEAVVVDPSAASFIQCLHRRGRWRVEPADNQVLTGIRRVACALRSGQIRIHASCKDAIREFSLYRWKEGAAGDIPLKQDDHAMDDIRYFATRFLDGDEPGFYASGISRSGAVGS